ncbi:hypothetical protein BD626DRAFT_506755 [Schizophyllum amplum]|uniref:tryptophan--tRNA ligase n=1 Tax=Schizophyllum amplum TaxID=97359 RepID=A0A550C527_9AGAR|nr:hypothetical protein BD626DRAFT_506755 [Auriculariopsis ampla]
MIGPASGWDQLDVEDRVESLILHRCSPPPTVASIGAALAGTSLADSNVEGASSSAPDIKPAPKDEGEQAQVVTPWDVQGGVTSDGKQKAIDYDNSSTNDALLQRFEKLTGHRPIDFSQILDRYEQGKPFFLYTGRGPSSDSMHLGHMVPFVFTKWMQDVFDVPLVVQLTGKRPIQLKVEQVKEFSRMNARDIIAVGFDLNKTFIFSDYSYMNGAFYENVSRISRQITYNQARATFGFNESYVVPRHFVAIQAAPSFSNSFPQISAPSPTSQRSSLARSTRTPRAPHSRFFPALQGPQTKMSASDPNSSIFMTDKPNQIKNKINKHAFSGGRETEEEHRELEGIRRWMWPIIKARCISLLQQFVADFQDRRSKITDEVSAPSWTAVGRSSPRFGKPKA